MTYPASTRTVCIATTVTITNRPPPTAHPASHGSGNGSLHFETTWSQLVFQFRRIVAGGTPSFPAWAAIDESIVECSPGTCLLQDAGYGGNYADLDFTPAALVLTRCISRPTPTRITFDLGSKAVASDPPNGQRVFFPDLPDAKAVLQNEEHLVLESEHADRFEPGDELLAIPTHICPTTALHKEVTVVQNGEVVDSWPVVARDRKLSI